MYRFTIVRQRCDGKKLEGLPLLVTHQLFKLHLSTRSSPVSLTIGSNSLWWSIIEFSWLTSNLEVLILVGTNLLSDFIKLSWLTSNLEALRLENLAGTNFLSDFFSLLAPFYYVEKNPSKKARNLPKNYWNITRVSTNLALFQPAFSQKMWKYECIS